MTFSTKNILRTIAFAAIALCITAALANVNTATAQGYVAGSSEAYDKDGVPYGKNYWKGTAIYNTVALIRKPELSENQFVLRLGPSSMMSGCANISNHGYYASYTEQYMDITITEVTIDNRDLPRYAHYECDVSTKMPVADIILDKDMLREQGIKTLRLHSQNRTNYFNLDLTDDRILLLPDVTDVSVDRAFRPMTLPMRKTTTIYWFYPEGTLVLWAPQEQDPALARSHLTHFAATNNLVPLSQYLFGFESPLHDGQYMYFIDATGKFGNTEGIENGTQIGHVSIETNEYGLHGNEKAVKDVLIFARRPGTYD